MKDKLVEISELLLFWYDKNKRDLPWRKTTNPYIIWISEIILQQTRVNQGLDYFLRFVERFPDATSLAAATDDEILKYWQGLGYYSRARNLHAAAQDIVARFDGKFPSRYEDIRSLKGIGEYTAAAIVSFAWNQPYPVVDGNVYRVLSRLFAVDTPIDSGRGKKEFTVLAAELLNRRHPGLHNQAMMELGALQCVPKSPDCPACPLAGHCMAYATGTVASLPVKEKKVKVKERYFHYFHISCKTDTFVNRREGDDIWKGLYEFPLIETSEPADLKVLAADKRYRELFDNISPITLINRVSFKHVLTHQIIHATFYHIGIDRTGPGLSRFQQIKEEELDLFAVSRLVHLYLEQLRT